MWSRRELKAEGKRAFKKNYWASVVVGTVLMFFLIGTTVGCGPSTTSKMQAVARQDQFVTELGFINPETLPALLIILAGIVITAIIVSTLIALLVANPIIVGGRKFFLENRKQEKTKAATLFYAFQCGNYGNIIKIMFLRNLFLFFWYCLFFFPGMVKHYSYWMVEYILAENPSISRQRAFEISRKTMRGEKWKVFVFDLSFMLWEILSVVTFGLLNIFYVNPYICATEAELYAELKEKALAGNFATAEELPD